MHSTKHLRAIFVHGWASGPHREWWPWLRSELEVRGWGVVAPVLPNPRVPVISTWVSALAEAIGSVDAETMFVGHSVGCQTILRYLQAYPEARPAGAVFVAGWFTLAGLNTAEERAVARPWLETPLDIAQVRGQLPRSVLLYSENDPYVPLENTAQFAAIGAEIISLGACGHIAQVDGVTELPAARAALLRFEQTS